MTRREMSALYTARCWWDLNAHSPPKKSTDGYDFCVISLVLKRIYWTIQRNFRLGLNFTIIVETLLNVLAANNINFEANSVARCMLGSLQNQK